ncbi:uncharacterized protein EURHEDRAFT_24650 [Aspergillus ruber CBS 135680]|uniref:Uncharacterized protein n=1 Tax=Aspergillus ruber (strain CBS 135680) TaxID=1388766 RepID=A0A017SS64_ASPRC|nr:uncharacterized protein EURHEDRAFT_24650 [Aspergillus ruber CBS 135680]EYE99626.1 hypothetical protein EURHEDRAFT_24650 [Aspergillus ruber CBS 135680]
MAHERILYEEKTDIHLLLVIILSKCPHDLQSFLGILIPQGFNPKAVIKEVHPPYDLTTYFSAGLRPAGSIV